MHLFKLAPTKVLIKTDIVFSQMKIIFGVSFYLTFINI